MTIEYPVKIKFNYDDSELGKIKNKVNTNVSGSAGGKQTTSKKGGSGLLSTMGKVTGLLGGIAAIMKVLEGPIQVIVQILQILVFVFITKLIYCLYQLTSTKKLLIM